LTFILFIRKLKKFIEKGGQMKPCLVINKFNNFRVCYISWDGDTIIGMPCLKSKTLYAGDSYEEAIKFAEKYSKENNLEIEKDHNVKQYEKKIKK
jgi:hypothetical protein